MLQSNINDDNAMILPRVLALVRCGDYVMHFPIGPQSVQPHQAEALLHQKRASLIHYERPDCKHLGDSAMSSIIHRGLALTIITANPKMWT
jgi:hypothetical protein